MSCPGDNYVVPGANPCALNNYIVVSERGSTNTPLTVTATTQATSQTVVSIVLSLDTVSNISIFSNFTVLSNNGGQNTLSFFIESVVNGVTSVVGFVNQNTIQGSAHYANCGLVAGTFKTPVSNVTLRLKVFASSASSLTVAPAQLLAIGNISQD